MGSFRMRFIVGKTHREELLTLKRGETILSKLLLTPDDYKLFHYKAGDQIEVETEEGNRIWTTIRNIEIVEDDSGVVVILTLLHEPSLKKES
ncbi:MAG: hypothetical protein WEB30_03430 [Cyclobacteriaceae bacterium]